MIRRFLRLFDPFSDLLASVTRLEAELESARRENAAISASLELISAELRSAESMLATIRQNLSYHETSHNDWRERCEKAESRADALQRELLDKLTIAGDSMALKATGRRMFSKATGEAPPSSEPKPIVSLGRRYAGDIAREQTARFRRSLTELAQEALVIPEDSKPN